MTKLRIAGTVNDSITDGPGLRHTVFVQGCPHTCKGCHNPQTHDFAGGKEVDIKQLLDEGLQNPLLCGVTFSGGEPMCQARALAELARLFRENGVDDIACYTGYLVEDLLAGKVDGADELMKELDVLVDGPFVQAQRCYDAKFKGSSNQRVIDVQATLRVGKPVICDEERWN